MTSLLKPLTLAAILLAAILAPAAAQPGAPLTLENAVGLALRANPALRAAAGEVAAQDGALAQAKALPNPELEVLRGAQQVMGRVQRVFAKAHARLADDTPLNRPIAGLLERNGFSVQVTRGEPAVGANPGWRMRDGDVYAERVR